MQTKIRTYESDDATVTWDQHRCIHYAACVRGLPDVFDPDRKPWVEPENAEPEAVFEVVTRCPTGALHFRRPDGTDPETVPDRNRVTIAADGPLYVRGDVTIQNAEGEVLLRDTRVALCRCGKSSNKPLCDNSHRDAFTDAGTLPDASGETADEGGALTVNLATNGPLRIAGPLTVVGADGATRAAEKAAFCRCGHSQNKPYCDGSHKQIEFVAP